MVIACILAVTTLTSGCARANARPEVLSASEVAQRYGYDTQSAAQTPVFALIPGYRDPRDGYARDLLARKCLKGVVEYLVVPPGSSSGIVDERTSQLMFSVSVAESSGYPQLRKRSTPDGAVPDDVTITPQIESAMYKCGEEADKRLGLPPERIPDSVESAGWAAVSASASVADAETSWVKCMAPAGVADLPQSPTEMPPASILSLSATKDANGNWHLGEASAVPDRERAVAVMDAQCRDQVRYDRAVFDTRVDAELTAIGRDIEGFEASRRAYEEYDRGLASVIAELG